MMEPAPTMMNWLELPPNLTENILHRLGAIEILESAQKVCTTWRKICKDPAMWRVIDMRNSGDLSAMPHLQKMCRHVVDRSEGQLIDINIEYFGTDELLDYIVERSSQLKVLKISCCYGCMYKGLSAAVKKLPLLEEIHLNHTYIAKEAIADAGCLCPHLKSFKFNILQQCKFSDIEGSEEPDEFKFNSDDEALAISKSMPQLRHLQFIGNQITDKGLKAILDGCPLLESLDLRLCHNLKLEDGLGKRCSEQIKDFKRPNDSMKGCEFVFEDKDDGYCSDGGFSFDDDDDMFSFDYDDPLSLADDDGDGDSGVCGFYSEDELMFEV
ncbi:hypothetical protein LguiA_014766 [Lonicera macranthoides]